ncbi:hypothetical protein evm_001429 [Chilo suppressalis]|nr:hypothetical protein evm_001429 [Chilo suppressalis]
MQYHLSPSTSINLKKSLRSRAAPSTSFRSSVVESKGRPGFDSQPRKDFSLLVLLKLAVSSWFQKTSPNFLEYTFYHSNKICYRHQHGEFEAIHFTTLRIVLTSHGSDKSPK